MVLFFSRKKPTIKKPTIKKPTIISLRQQLWSLLNNHEFDDESFTKEYERILKAASVQKIDLGEVPLPIPKNLYPNKVFRKQIKKRYASFNQYNDFRKQQEGARKQQVLALVKENIGSDPLSIVQEYLKEPSGNESKAAPKKFVLIPPLLRGDGQEDLSQAPIIRHGKTIRYRKT